MPHATAKKINSWLGPIPTNSNMNVPSLTEIPEPKDDVPEKVPKKNASTKGDRLLCFNFLLLWSKDVKSLQPGVMIDLIYHFSCAVDARWSTTSNHFVRRLCNQKQEHLKKVINWTCEKKNTSHPPRLLFKRPLSFLKPIRWENILNRRSKRS